MFKQNKKMKMSGRAQHTCERDRYEYSSMNAQRGDVELSVVRSLGYTRRVTMS